MGDIGPNMGVLGHIQNHVVRLAMALYVVVSTTLQIHACMQYLLSCMLRIPCGHVLSLRLLCVRDVAAAIRLNNAPRVKSADNASAILLYSRMHIMD